MIRLTSQYLLDIFFWTFFIALFTFGMLMIEDRGYLNRGTLTLFDVTLITLASFRMIRLFVYDSMTRFIREQLLDSEVDEVGVVTLIKPKAGLRRTLGELMSCPWCFGVWSAATVTFFYMLTPLAYFPTLVLAIAGVATLIQLLANLIGWKAEQLKREVEG